MKIIVKIKMIYGIRNEARNTRKPTAAKISVPSNESFAKCRRRPPSSIRNIPVKNIGYLALLLSMLFNFFTSEGKCL